jgi:hypothetical protein
MRNVGEKQSLTRFAAGSGSQVQRDPTSSHYGRPPRQFAGLCRTGKSPLPGQGLLFINIPRSAFRNPHFPIRISQNQFAFLICHAGEARRGYLAANWGR